MEQSNTSLGFAMRLVYITAKRRCKLDALRLALFQPGLEFVIPLGADRYNPHKSIGVLSGSTSHQVFALFSWSWVMAADAGSL